MNSPAMPGMKISGKNAAIVVMVDVVTGSTVVSVLRNPVEAVKGLALPAVTTTTTNGWYLLR